MTQLTDGASFRSIFGTRLLSMALSAIVLMLAQAFCSPSAVAQTNTFPASGNAGVGTTSPTEKLEVVGTVKSSGGLTITGAPAEPAYLNALYLGMSGNTAIIDAVDQMVDFRDLVISAKNFRVNTWNGGSLVTGLFQNTAGNVGIGTTNPGRPLVVTADASGIPLRVYRNANTVGWGTGIQWSFNNSAGNVADYAFVNSSIVSNTAGAENGTLGFFTVKTGALTQQAIIDQNGNVGIGTTAPQRLITLYKASSPVLQLADSTSGSTANDGLLLIQSGLDSYVENSEAGNLFLRTNATNRVTIDSSGNVGIGNTAPTAKLDITGNLNASGAITGGTINAKYQDVAEWVPASHALPTGTVVTLDPTKSNHVEASSQAYDTRVAGVVSEQPGITLGESGENKVLVATTGRVRVTVDASHAPIHIGDLLVTSDIPGVAMKSEPIKIGGRQFHSPGTLIGKALEPLEKGSGKILVLLSLQ